MNQARKIIFYKSYFIDFFDKQTINVKDKIDQVLFVVAVADRIPNKFFDHLTGTDGLYEVRVEFQGNIYRIFCCFDEGKIIVLFNGFQKNRKKLPRQKLTKH